jgi:hypothetical protein
MLIECGGVTDSLSSSAPKSSFTSGSGGSLGSGLAPMLGNKRDSFKLLAASSSSKDQLHTLVEEEEEEEEESVQQANVQEDGSAPSLADSDAIPDSSEFSATSEDVPKEQEAKGDLQPAVEPTIAHPVPTRPRPVTLNLRPLSLTPENLASLQGLPTPSWTPSPLPGLKPLSLSCAPPVEEAQNGTSATPAPRRPQLFLKLSNSNTNSVPTPDSDENRSRRRSSITYKPSSHGIATSYAGLPTPEMTPTFKDSVTESVRSTKSDDEFFPGGSFQNRRLSASEQHFLVKSHNALLARITDLERALTNRRRVSSGYARSDFGCSRPTSMLSDTSSDAGSEPSDEMFKLVADLKAERDELKKDVDGWRTRVGDMEKQMTILTKRVETERREAWLARSQAGLLEIEKAGVEKKLEDVETAFSELNKQNQTLSAAKEDLAKENEEIKMKMQELEEQIKVAQMELTKERELMKLREEETLATRVIRPSSSRPRSPYGRNAGTEFASIDSIGSSTTEVEIESADDCEARFSFMLKAVQEEDESTGFCDDDEEDSGLAGYEDEDDSDASFRSSSSFDSMDDHARTPIQPATPSTPKPRDASFSPPSNAQQPAHKSTGSWSKTWTFPRVANPQNAPQHHKQDSVDRFFGCFDDESSSEGGSTPCSPSQYSFEKNKSLFVDALKDADEDDSPFFIPRVADAVTEESRLGAVLEEEEEENTEDDEFDMEMFGEMGGIRITLSPPQPEDDELIIEPLPLVVQTVPRSIEKPPQLPMLNFGDDETDDVGFNFGRVLERTRYDEVEKGIKATVPTVVVLPPPDIVITPPAAAVAHSPVDAVLPAVIQTPPSSIPRPRPASPSAIPRFSVPKLASPEPPKTTPSSTFKAHVPLPSKRGGTTPTFIPQLVSSPSPIRIASPATKSKLTGTSAFIPQPQRKPLMSTSAGNVSNSGTSSNGSNPTSQIAIRTY